MHYEKCLVPQASVLYWLAVAEARGGEEQPCVIITLTLRVKFYVAGYVGGYSFSGSKTKKSV
jgi:hypothetical protein